MAAGYTISPTTFAKHDGVNMLRNGKPLLALLLTMATSACSAANVGEVTDDKQDAGALDPADSSAGTPVSALTGLWRFCGLTKQAAWYTTGVGGSVYRIDATSPGLVATKIFPDGGDGNPFFRASYNPNSRVALAAIYWPHYRDEDKVDGNPPPLDTWIQYYDEAMTLTFNRAGDRAQGSLSVTQVSGGLAGGREDGDFACPTIPE